MIIRNYSSVRIIYRLLRIIDHSQQIFENIMNLFVIGHLIFILLKQSVDTWFLKIFLFKL